MIESIQELLQKEAQAVLNIPVTDAYEKAVELIVEQIHRKKGKLVTSGMGGAFLWKTWMESGFSISNGRLRAVYRSVLPLKPVTVQPAA